MACQICLEDFTNLLVGDPAIVRVQRLCVAGSECTADVCSRCLQQHIQTILDGCIRGVLPRVRCPICLTAMTKTQWIKFIPASSGLVSQYEELAASAFAMTPSCCHAVGYTHLPQYDAHACVSLLTSWTDTPKVFQTLMDDFVSHRVDAASVVAFLTGCEGINNVESILQRMLTHIYDDERRGALYLSYLNRFPSTFTLCCGHRFCFNCKGTYCTEVCEVLDGFDELINMMRCRQCRVMILVTDGSDSVNCVCGFEMSWTDELNYRDWDAKGLIGVDLLDLQLMERWEAKRTMLVNELTTHCTERRLKQVTRLIAKHRSTLKRCLGLWRRQHQQRHVEAATATTTSADILIFTAATPALVD